MAQLANIPTRITLYELLRLSKSTRGALREELADVEIFMTQIPAISERKTATIVTTPRKNFPASPSPQKTCKLKENMIDPYIIQGILDHLN